MCASLLSSKASRRLLRQAERFGELAPALEDFTFMVISMDDLVDRIDKQAKRRTVHDQHSASPDAASLKSEYVCQAAV